MRVALTLAPIVDLLPDAFASAGFAFAPAEAPACLLMQINLPAIARPHGMGSPVAWGMRR
jgi:hypothetical protein